MRAVAVLAILALLSACAGPEAVSPGTTIEPTQAMPTADNSATAEPSPDDASEPAPSPSPSPPCDPDAGPASTGVRGELLWRGVPAAGHRVELRKWDLVFEGELYSSTTTGPDGSFELGGSPAGTLEFSIPRQPPYVYRGYEIEACGGQVLDIGSFETFLEITGLSLDDGQVVDPGPLTISWDALEHAEHYCVGLFSVDPATGGEAVVRGTCAGISPNVRVDGISYTTPPLASGEYHFTVTAHAEGFTFGETQAGGAIFRVR